MKYDLNRRVGEESQRTYVEKCQNGFFDKYMTGKGLDVGFSGYLDNIVPILPDAIGVDTNYPGYDGKTLPFADGSMDYVYTSHCLEHIRTNVLYHTIMDWYRVVKIGGFIIITVPHQYAYEKKKCLPSKWNGDHQKFYTPGILLSVIETALEPNSYRVISLKDNVNPNLINHPPSVHSDGCYEIELVLQKVQKPDWSLE